MPSLTSKMNVLELDKEIGEKVAFLACASFENRSLHVAQHIDPQKVICAYVFSMDETEIIQQRKADMLALFPSSKEIMVNKHDPISCRKKAYDTINSMVQSGIHEALIDITTFTHEMLLILLNVLWRKKGFFKRVSFVYTSAEEYCPNEKEKWLSKGCREVRSILGYPGLLVPKKQLCLIVLVGFEHERALGLIDKVDPDMLYMGCGMLQERHVTSVHHIEPMKAFNDLHRSLVSSRANVCTFDFSARDIDSTFSAIIHILNETPEYNHIIVPMNTKLSTLATGMIALSNQHIQLCYAEPETYNSENYSSCSNDVLFYSWDCSNDLHWD